jgi:hypothetical protein
VSVWGQKKSVAGSYGRVILEVVAKGRVSDFRGSNSGGKPVDAGVSSGEYGGCGRWQGVVGGSSDRVSWSEKKKERGVEEDNGTPSADLKK